MGRHGRVKWFVGLFLVCAAVFAASAYAATNYTYYARDNTQPGQGGGDLTVVYRNWNDSCSVEGYGETKSIYSLANGTWVASIKNFDECAYSKAHLGPSTNYGYTYVQSKCLNADTVLLSLLCETTRPS